MLASLPTFGVGDRGQSCLLKGLCTAIRRTRCNDLFGFFHREASQLDLGRIDGRRLICRLRLDLRFGHSLNNGGWR